MKSHDEKAMNANRAREVFSQIYEGVADDYTRRVFERALEQDPALREEYAEFVRACAVLSEMAHEPVEVPADLHETISARLDKHIWETRDAKKKFFGLPSWSLGGLAAVAVAATVFAAVNRPQDGRSIAPMIPVPAAKVLPAKAGFTYVGGRVHLTATSERPVRLTVKRTDDDVVQQTYDVRDAKSEVDAPLINNGAEPVGLTVKVSDGQTPLYIMLPGTQRDTSLTGEGDLTAVAKAVAAHYGTPIVLVDPYTVAKTYRWTFQEGDTAQDVQARLVAAGVSVEIMPTGILRISP